MMVGEIGGSAEQDAAAYIMEHMRKPVVAFISGEDGKAAGVVGAAVSDSPAEIGATMKRLLG